MDISSVLSKEFNIRQDFALNIINLIAEGNTIPFIARYRKEMTGSMDDQVLRDFADRLDYLGSLIKRKEEVKASITEQGKWTDEIAKALDAAIKLNEVEDIYRPYKQKKKTRASVAAEFHNVGHNSWDPAYATAELYDWWLANVRPQHGTAL
jgi:uncharacterized protein